MGCRISYMGTKTQLGVGIMMHDATTRTTNKQTTAHYTDYSATHYQTYYSSASSNRKCTEQCIVKHTTKVHHQKLCTVSLNPLCRLPVCLSSAMVFLILASFATSEKGSVSSGADERSATIRSNTADSSIGATGTRRPEIRHERGSRDYSCDTITASAVDNHLLTFVNKIRINNLKTSCTYL